ncbi:hypothetical protein BH10PLA1_BH10PLA1_19560 [soil metagenome]
MQKRRSSPALILIACSAMLLLPVRVAHSKTPNASNTPPPAELPARVKAFEELSKQCAAYDRAVSKSGWGPIWSETFDAKTSAQWLPSADALAAPPVPEGANRPSWPKISAATVEHREVATMDASAIQAGYWPIGPKVRGEFAIEFVGMAQSANPCDMSIVLDSLHTGLAFQFGANMNARNLLWFPIPEQGPGQSAGMELPNTAVIQQGRWHKVRLEFRGGLLTASVDGEVMGTRKIASLGSHAYQPMLYVYHSQIAVDEIKVEGKVPVPTKVDPDEVFGQVFGGKSRKDVGEQIDHLVELLDDSNYNVRDAAGKMLAGMGSLTLPALKDAMENGSPEAIARARPLYEAIAPLPAVPATTKPAMFPDR